MEQKLPDIILASSSKYRQQLMAKLRLPFSIYSPDIDESPLNGESPIVTVKRLAQEKAEKAASVAATTSHSPTVCIGSDTAADFKGTVMGKPQDHADAIAQLKQLSGERLAFHTGLSVIRTDQKFVSTEVITTFVVFRKLTDNMIENYLAKQQPYYSAASLQCEDLGAAIMEKFEGDDFNALIGLPLIRLVRMLEACGVHVV